MNGVNVHVITFLLSDPSLPAVDLIRGRPLQRGTSISFPLLHPIPGQTPCGLNPQGVVYCIRDVLIPGISVVVCVKEGQVTSACVCSTHS